MVNSKILTIISLLLILSVGITSAQTLIAGKIYNADYSEPIFGAEIHVVCNSHSLPAFSLSDGTYAIIFNETDCNATHTAIITVSKSGFNTNTNADDPGVISECEEGDCGGKYFTIINLGLDVVSSPTPTTSGSSGGGGGSSRYYLCGNGICDSGETANTCPQDCNIIELGAELTDNQFDSEETQTQETQEPEETPQTTFSKITGAVTGAVNSTTGMITILFLMALAGVFVVERTLRKRKSLLKI